MSITLERYTGRGTCSCGKDHTLTLQELCIEGGAVRQLEKALSKGKWAAYRHYAVVCDENTRKAAEPYMKKIFRKAEVVELPSDGLHANNHGVALLEEKLSRHADLLLAVGAGTIHDLTRYVAYQRGIPFLSVPTAASVDGFVSSVAAMTWDGRKVTMPAAAPLAVYAEPAIFAKAPRRLTASGVGDLLGKVVCLADWEIGHLVTGEYYCERIAAMEREAVGKVSDGIGAIAKQDETACSSLMEALILSGLAMQMVGNSRPASGAEHHMSHFWEMEVINGPLDALHGEKVAVGTVLMLKYYHGILEGIRSGKLHVFGAKKDNSSPADTEAHGKKALYGIKDAAAVGLALEREEMEETYGKAGLLEGIREENGEELLLAIPPERLEDSLEKIAQLLETLPKAEQISSLLSVVSCPVTMKDIGLSDREILRSIRLSPYVRHRLTLNWLSKMMEVTNGY